MSGVRSYRDLEVWQMGVSLVKRVYRLAATLPDSERFGIVSQLQRAAVSVPANLAEGWASGHRRQYVRHISIARGSLAELETLLILCVEVGYVRAEMVTDLTEFVDALSRRTHALKASLDHPSPAT